MRQGTGSLVLRVDSVVSYDATESDEDDDMPGMIVD